MRNRKGTESGLGALSTAGQVIAVTAGIFNTKAMNKTLAWAGGGRLAECPTQLVYICCVP